MRPLIPNMPHPGPVSHWTALTLRRLLRSQRTPVTGDTPLAANAHYVAVPVMHLEHNAVASRRRAHRRPDGERASLGEVLRALTGAYRGSVVLRLQECYMTRGAMVKKSTGSCLIGWACDPGPFGSTVRRLCGRPPRLAAITRPVLSRISRIGNCRSSNPGLS